MIMATVSCVAYQPTKVNIDIKMREGNREGTYTYVLAVARCILTSDDALIALEKEVFCYLSLMRS